MVEQTKEATLKVFRQIPSVGKRIANDLWSLGFRSLQEISGQDPESMYLRLCEIQGTHVDRCMLYVFRCVVYYTSHEQYEPEKLKWWNWKDEIIVCVTNE